METSSDSSISIAADAIKLNEEDFPDVCVQCDLCVKSIKEAVQVHSASQIKDSSLAEAFALSAEKVFF